MLKVEGEATSLRAAHSTVRTPWAVPGPASTTAMPRRSTRRLRQRGQLLDEFNRRSDPRQGLLHHVDVLLALLDAQFGLAVAVISLCGPEPRIFCRGIDGRTRQLDEPAATLWRTRRGALADETQRVLLALGPQTLALPLMSYGKPHGHLCVTREHPQFTAADLQWLHDTMREVLPLLERSDLLEQLQRETAAAQRERIGRDLHDSAVQPYLGMKYGLEALARQAAADNPLCVPIRQLIDLTTQELQNLRDVVSGLRDGYDPLQSTTFLAALHRQVDRFEALYGLKIRIAAPQELQLRGSAAKAVLHMVNEGLTNARRHTGATRVDVSIDVVQGDVVVRLRNDRGAAGRDGAVAVERPFVPRSLNERAIEFGGGVQVDRDPHYTEVVIHLPMLGALA